jgi:hypothetical protein
MAIPIIGGYLSQTLGYQFSFLFGAFFVALSILSMYWMQTRRLVPVPAASAE